MFDLMKENVKQFLINWEKSPKISFYIKQICLNQNKVHKSTQKAVDFFSASLF